MLIPFIQEYKLFAVDLILLIPASRHFRDEKI